MRKTKKLAVEDRKGGIGGSDIASICGCGWKTPLQLWAEKTGRLEPEDLSNNEAVELGTELEDTICKIFEKKSGLKVRKQSLAYIHPKYEFMWAHIDRKIQGKNAILEAKNMSYWRTDEWKGEDELPTHVIYQTIWNTGIAQCDVGYAAAILGGQRFKWREVEFEKEMFELMVERAKEFWQMVQNDTPPVAIVGDKETLAELYPGDEDTVLELTDEEKDKYNEIVNILQIAKDSEKKYKEEKERLENGLKELIKNFESTETDRFKIKLKKQKTTPKTNYKAMKEDGVFDKYCVQGETRVLRITEKKEKKTLTNNHFVL